MKNLPLGQQDFRGIIEGNSLYVDKTKHIYKLLSNKYYFLSRPCKFGKSLLISTLKETFEGNKELFKDLWISDKIEWEKHPVIHISFNDIDFQTLGLETAINLKLKRIAAEFEVKLSSTTYPSKFKELIEKLSSFNKVVVLIDDYDKPIIDYFDDLPKAEEHRQILKNFYSTIKDQDKNLRFFFITGVSKLSKGSVFKNLNNIDDITIDRRFAELTGITQTEMESNFSEQINILKEELGEYYKNIDDEIKNEYFGYSWDGKTKVYNPFSLLNLFNKLQFGDFWYQSGTPMFLMSLIKENNYTIFDLENKKIFLSTFAKCDINDISLISLLFQTGYLTIKKFDIRKNAITLGFPNREVERSFSIHLLTSINDGKSTKTNCLLLEMTESVEENRIADFIKLLKTLFKGISNTIINNKERYYQSVFYLVIKILGFNIESEILTIDGRINAVLFTEKIIYVIEFKIKNKNKAIDQIREKAYYEKYANDKRSIQLLGIDFDMENKSIADVSEFVNYE